VPEADGFTWFETGELGFAVATRSVDVIAIEQPEDDVIDLSEVWGSAPREAEDHYFIAIRHGEDRGWLAAERSITMLRASEVVRHALPELVRERLVSVGVEALVERERRLGYVLSAAMLLRAGGEG